MSRVVPGARGLLNPSAGQSPRGLFTREDLLDVIRFFEARPDLEPTPLRRLRGLAARAGTGAVRLKDESNRFGLPAFKIVGVTYAVGRLLSGRLKARRPLAAATSGNHGRAVARAARLRGLPARIYVPQFTAPARIEALAGEGARVTIVDGTYDDTVRRLAADAAREGWTIVSDQSWPGYEEIPRLIMAGYTWIVEEASRQWDERPDVVLVQAGVGGLAAAVVSWTQLQPPGARPRVVACEPAAAACLLEAARAGGPVRLDGPLETIMGGLRCGEVSPAAWPAIAGGIHAFVAIPDAWTLEAIDSLGHPPEDDPPVSAGPSGACGAGALLALAEDPALAEVREACGLGPDSRVLIVNTEAGY